MSKLQVMVSHHDAEVDELRADRDLAVEYLREAMESLDDPDDRAAGLLALRTHAIEYKPAPTVTPTQPVATSRQHVRRRAA